MFRSAYLTPSEKRAARAQAHHDATRYALELEELIAAATELNINRENINTAEQLGRARAVAGYLRKALEVLQ
jgi:hypothetical protein